MLYQKYIIESIEQKNLLSDIVIDSTTNNYSYNSFGFEIKKIECLRTIILFMDNLGNCSNYCYKFNTYEEAYRILDIHYNRYLNNYINFKIVEVLDNMPLPILIQRNLKLKRIIKKQ